MLDPDSGWAARVVHRLLYWLHSALSRVWYRLGRVLQYTKRFDA